PRTGSRRSQRRELRHVGRTCSRVRGAVPPRAPRTTGVIAVRHGSDQDLFSQTAHSPSFFDLSRKLGDGARDLVDFCIPCNPYFPTPDMFAELAQNLEGVLKFYPSDNATIANRLAKV